MKIKLLLVLFLGMFIINPVFSLEERNVIRVAISNQNFSSYDYQNIKLSSENIIKIIDVSKQNTLIGNIEAGKIIEIIMTSGYYNVFVDDELKYQNLNGPLLFSSNAELQIIGLNRKGTPAKYKGMIELRTAKNNQRFNVINIIDMQNYIRGVVPNEMPVSFGLEALKAQSIAARNYATNANMSENYDLVDSTAAQVYYGANSYREISDEAVNTTKGIYALYNEKPIMALYFSTSPGFTDDWDMVFADDKNTGSHPYLKSKPDLNGQNFLYSEDDVISFYSKKDNGLDINSPKFRWSFEFTRKELEGILHNTLQQQSRAGLVEPKYDGDIVLEGLKDIKPLKRTKTGKITELLIQTKNGDYKIKKEIGIRRVLKKNNTMLPSANFYIEKSGEENLQNETEQKPTLQPSGLLKLFSSIDLDTYPANFKITGGGFGHGVGMSQFGAYNMAKKGKKYPEILHHYYSDINLSTMPKTVLFNEYNINYRIEFNFDKSTFNSAYLIINNKNQATEYPFIINDLEFNDTYSAAKNNLSKINITQYLKNGQNTISFKPLTRENKGKTVTYRVEFK